MRAPRICQVCGIEFTPKQAVRTTCCSRMCGLQYTARKVRVANLARGVRQRATRQAAIAESMAPQPCVVCARDYQRLPGQLYCSDQCRKEQGRRRYRARVGVRRAYCGGRPSSPPRNAIPMACAHCGVEYVPQANAQKRYCSRQCSERSGNREREARLRNQYVAKVSLAAIYLRDGGRCALCGGDVPKGLTVPHPHSATLDHVVPLSRGGTHEPSNVQLAHFTCNIRKGAKVVPRSDVLTQCVSA